MKRILYIPLFTAIASMFFTGCNSIILSIGEDDFEEVSWEVMEDWDGTAPDYYAENEKNKYKNLKGDRAFKFKDGHSEDASDITDFQIGTLLEDGTFIYTYVTKEGVAPADGSADHRNTVHCAAAYNYRTQQFKVIHEHIFQSTNEDEESFYLQICEGTDSAESNMFIYDNGTGYLYDVSGTLQFQANIETFVRSYFQKAASVTTTRALTDGADKIYLELTIEKEELQLEEPDTTTDSDEDFSEEEADKEAEALEAEIEEKTLEIVFVYDFKELTSTIDQRNKSIDDQAKKWAQIAQEHGAYTSEPDAEADWETAKESVPDQWGTAFFDYLPEFTVTESNLLMVNDINEDGRPVLEWTDEPSFVYTEDGYICSFVPSPLQSRGFTGLEENSKLSNVFTTFDYQYYEAFGDVGSFLFYGNKSFTRKYRYQWTETTTAEDGTVTEENKYEDRTQEISVPAKRYAPVSNGYMEGYHYLAGVDSIFGAVDGKILCSSNGVLYWRLQDGSYQLQGLHAPDDYIIDVNGDAENVRTVFSGESFTLMDERAYGASRGTYKLILEDRVSNALSASSYVESIVDQKYHDEYTRRQEELLDGVEASELLSAEDILPLTVSIDKEALSLLEENGVNAGSLTASGTGYLLTTFGKGLVYYDTGAHIATVLDGGTWYRTWKQGSDYISVGFSNSEASYGTLDVAFARVYEFDPGELYETAVDEIIKTVDEQKEQ